VLLFATRRSQYAIDPALGLLLQLPGGTSCGLRPGVWHRVVWDRHPRTGERFFCSVTPRDGGVPVAIRTGVVTWVGPEPPLPAYAEILAAAAAR
jgi:hypothetical protein